MTNANAKRVAVIGGGLSGLVAAFELRHKSPDLEVVLYESSDHTGGVIQTEYRDDFLLEYGADSFSVQPAGAIELCEDLGIADRLISPLDQYRRALILRGDRLIPVPEGFALLRPTDLRSVFFSPLFSMRGRLRLLAEMFVRRKSDDDDESLESFALRRFGREAFDRLIQPLVAGIYTADASQLSMKATMPQFVELERKHGGMIRATRALSRSQNDQASRSASGARYAQFRSFPRGMTELFEALRETIGPSSIRTSSRVHSLRRNESGNWIVRADGGSEERYDAIVTALPSGAASRLLADASEAASQELSQISYASSALVLLGVPKRNVRHPLDAFGMVVPSAEQREIIAASFSSRKFPGRAPDDHHLIRVFIGGAMQSDLLRRSDDELIETAISELSFLIGLSGRPTLQHIARWTGAMPQYHIGHCERRERIESAIRELPGLELAGNALHGVGIAFCINTARAAANRIVNHLQR